eukprot:100825-Hanusia_phi.AAC.1
MTRVEEEEEARRDHVSVLSIADADQIIAPPARNSSQTVLAVTTSTAPPSQRQAPDQATRSGNHQ